MKIKHSLAQTLVLLLLFCMLALSAYKALPVVLAQIKSADINNDGLVNAQDFRLVLAAWGIIGPNEPEDIDENGVVNSLDGGVVIKDWSGSPTPTSPPAKDGLVYIAGYSDSTANWFYNTYPNYALGHSVRYRSGYDFGNMPEKMVVSFTWAEMQQYQTAWKAAGATALGYNYEPGYTNTEMGQLTTIVPQMRTFCDNHNPPLMLFLAPTINIATGPEYSAIDLIITQYADVYSVQLQKPQANGPSGVVNTWDRIIVPRKNIYPWIQTQGQFSVGGQQNPADAAAGAKAVLGLDPSNPVTYQADFIGIWSGQMTPSNDTAGLQQFMQLMGWD